MLWSELDWHRVRESGRRLQTMCHEANQTWWPEETRDEETGSLNPEKVDVPQKLCLIHSEISEALEGDRKGLMDDHLPRRKSIEVELADAAIRIFDLAGALGLDIGAAMAEKMKYNASRADHKPDHRAADGGKKY